MIHALLLSLAVTPAAVAAELPEEILRGVDADAVRAAAEAPAQDPVAVEIRPVEGTPAPSDFIGEGVTVKLKNGGRLEGILHDDAENIWLEVDGGKIGFELGIVESIEVKPNRHSEFREREAAVDAADPAALWALASWASARGLSGYARATSLRVIGLDADHAGARALLGYEKIGGRWLSHDEAMVAKGYVRFEGRWITKAEQEAILRERDERRRARLEDERRVAEENARREAEFAAERERQRLREQEELERLRRIRRRHRHNRRHGHGPVIIVPGGRPHHPHHPGRPNGPALRGGLR